MDFDILLEGTMIGAEINALSEAELVISKDISSSDEFAEAVIKAFKDQIKKMSEIRKSIQNDIKANINAVTQNKDKIVETLRNSNSVSSVGGSSSIIGGMFGSKNGFFAKFVIGVRQVFHTVDVDKEIKKSIEADLGQLEGLVNKAKDNTSPEVAYAMITTGLRAMYAFGDRLNQALGRLKAVFSGNNLRNWRTSLKQGFVAANRKSSEFNVNAVTTSAKNVVGDALNQSRRALNQMTNAINRSGARPLFDVYNAFAINWNKHVLKTDLAKTAGLSRVTFMNTVTGDIKVPTPKEATAANKQADSTITKVKGKIEALIEKIKNQINEPSIATVAVSVVVAIATYLVLYGAVKAAGGKVGSPVAISTTFKAAGAVIAEGSFAKKLVILALFGIVSAAFVAAGTVGFKFIKAKLAK